MNTPDESSAPGWRRLAIAACAAVLLAACSVESAPSDRSAPTTYQSPVRVTEVRLSGDTRELRLPGIVRAAQRAEPAFLHPGHLAERFVTRGARVEAGQRLASLQNPALGPALAAAEARVRELDERLVQLAADYERAKTLQAQGLASEELLDRTRAERNATREARAQAVAALAEARDQLAEAVLRAPFAATVSDLLVEPGDFVHAGQPVLVLAGDAGREVEIQLPEGLAEDLRPGDEVRIRALASGEWAAGQLQEIGRARAGRPAPAVVALNEDTAWEPGLSVYVMLQPPIDPALLVPLGAIMDPGAGETRVFRVVDGRAVLTPVTAGRLVGGLVEVSGDLAPGDRVVIAGQQQLLDGESVRVLP